MIECYEYLRVKEEQKSRAEIKRRAPSLLPF